MPRLGEVTAIAELYDTTLDQRSFKRGEIYKLDLDDLGYGSRFVQMKSRPGLIISNDIGNVHSGTVIVALLTGQFKKPYPFQYRFTLNDKESIIMFEQIITIDKFRIKEKMGELSQQQMREADMRLMNSLQLNRFSLENVMDLSVVSVIARRTKEGVQTLFETNLFFSNNQVLLIQSDLDKLREFDETITEDIDFDILTKKLDCCKGLHWLVTHNEYRPIA